MPVHHHLHDGPSEPFYGTRRPVPGRSAATLAALQWAADRAGLSYGQFIIGLTEEDQRRIQTEYEQFLISRKEEMVARPRVDIDTPSTSDRTSQSREASSTPDEEA